MAPHKRRRRLRLVVSLLAAGAALLTALPAQAGPAVQPDTATPRVAATQPGVAAPKLPAPVTVPGKGKVAPFTSKMTPISPKPLPGMEKATGSLLDPAKARAMGSKLHKATPPTAKPNAGPDDPWSYLFCTETIDTDLNTVPDPDNYTATISYTAQLGCNFYLYYGYGVAGIVDRSAGYDGTILQTSYPFEFYNNYYGSTSNALTIPGDYYDGGREVEVVFELYLVTPYGIPWVACNPLPGLRYITCEGLGTDFLHIVVGTGAFSTLLNRPTIRYTALGDSFSSGTGAPPYVGVPGCRRTNTAYAYSIQGLTMNGLPIDRARLRACHGAVVSDIYGPYIEPTSQLSDVKPFTRLVTLTAGGNDLGFAPKLRGCATPGGACPDPLITPTELLATKLRLTQLYRDIRYAMHPEGRVYVIGYPQFLPDPDDPADPKNLVACFGTDFFLRDPELRRIREATRQARDMVRQAVAELGDPKVRFVDTLDLFRGHRVCSSDPYSTGITPSDFMNSFHPNAAGHREIGRALEAEIRFTIF